jgi:hypothetical protein
MDGWTGWVRDRTRGRTLSEMIRNNATLLTLIRGWLIGLLVTWAVASGYSCDSWFYALVQCVE